MPHHYFKEHGERLVELGYRIVPLPPGSKGPRLPGWQKLKATPEDVKRMAANGSRNAGIGVLAATTPAIDVDVMDPEVAQRMSDEIDRIFAGIPLMTRTGMAPKFLIPFRTDQPFRKITSSTYTDGKHEHRIEILGDGQQWVAYHVHPGTGNPYAWYDGLTDDGITSVSRSDLPVLTPEAARLVVDAFERIAAEMVAAGRWSVKSATRPEAPAAVHDAFDSYAPVTGADVAATLAKIPNADVDYDRWFTVLAAVHHETDGAGRELAYAWSSSSGKHTDERFDTTWNSLGRSGARPVTLRTLLKDVKPTPKQEPLTTGFVQAASFVSAHSVKWHVKHVLPESALSVVYGEPGSGKSFFVLDLVMSIVRGVAWRGHRVTTCPVAYVAAEGIAGFGNRLAAYAEHHGVDLSALPLHVLGRAIVLEQSTLALIEEVERLGARIVVIDTLAAVSPGANENTSEDMGKLIKSANLVTEATGATVVFIHHANKQGAMRGWSGLLGAADQTIRIERDEGRRTAYLEKMKEGRDDGNYPFKLRSIILGTDEDGDDVTSCVVEESEEVAVKGAARRRANGGQFERSPQYEEARKYIDLMDAITTPTSDCVTFDEFYEALCAHSKSEEPGKKPPRKDNVKRTLLRLPPTCGISVDWPLIRVSRNIL